MTVQLQKPRQITGAVRKYLQKSDKSKAACAKENFSQSKMEIDKLSNRSNELSHEAQLSLGTQNLLKKPPEKFTRGNDADVNAST